MSCATFFLDFCIPISSLVRYLDLTFDPEEIDSADTVRALDFIATSDFGGREFMWNHILTSWRDPNIFPDGYGNQLVLLQFMYLADLYVRYTLVLPRFTVP